MEMLHVLRTRLHRLGGIFETLEGIIFGTTEVTAAAPHVRDHIETKRYMGVVILSLAPTALAAIYFFRLDAIKIILASYISGAVVEVLFALIRKKEIEEGFLVTGLIFPLTLPPTTPVWIVVVGSVFGVFFGKEVFGGLGRNIFNPALVGRLFITIAFPQVMSASWRAPFTDAITAATPLSMYKADSNALPSIFDLLLGQTGGSMGELFRLGILAGGIFLMITKISNWRIPVMYLGTVAGVSLIGTLIFPGQIAGPVFQIFSGGLLFGAMFMATDPVTSPYTRAGKYVFGVVCGLLTVSIRAFSGYTEGVMFSIIFMNALTPLLDHLVINIKYMQLKS